MHPPTQSHYSQNAPRLVRDYQSADASELHGILGRWLPVGGRVLEIGGGAGRDAAFKGRGGLNAFHAAWRSGRGSQIFLTLPIPAIVWPRPLYLCHLAMGGS